MKPIHSSVAALLAGLLPAPFGNPAEKPKNQIDHIIWAVPDLETGDCSTITRLEAIPISSSTNRIPYFVNLKTGPTVLSRAGFTQRLCSTRASPSPWVCPQSTFIRHSGWVRAASRTGLRSADCYLSISLDLPNRR